MTSSTMPIRIPIEPIIVAKVVGTSKVLHKGFRMMNKPARIPKTPFSSFQPQSARSHRIVRIAKKPVTAPSEGGLPEDSVIVSWWSASTLLWYGQRVERLRPDVYIVDDRTRLDDNLGEVWDVIDRFLGQRPVFVIRMTGGRDGMEVISAMYDLVERPLPDGSTVRQVISKKGMP